MSLEDLSRLVQERRMISPPLFSKEKVSDKLVKQLLENTNWAPNHRKTEPWRFHVFSGAKLEHLGDHFQAVYQAHILNDKFSEMKYKKLKTKTLQSSHVLAICMQRDPKESIPEWEEVAAVACAVQNLWLSATAAGLGGYWSSPALQMEHFGEFVPLAIGERCLGFFYLGIPKKEITLEGKRGAIEEKVTWHE
ncbi:MAG: nitroreductase [Bacteroidota bacterium]